MLKWPVTEEAASCELLAMSQEPVKTGKIGFTEEAASCELQAASQEPVKTGKIEFTEESCEF